MPRLIPPALGNGKRPSADNYGPGTVPILDVSEKTHALVGDEHAAALATDDETQLLTGAVLVFGNPNPVDSDVPGNATVHVGASTLHEAATEVVTCVSQLALDMPDFVACTDAKLAKVVAEHFTVQGYHSCEVRKLSEVTA